MLNDDKEILSLQTYGPAHIAIVVSIIPWSVIAMHLTHVYLFRTASASSNTRHSATSQRSSRDGNDRFHGSDKSQHPVPPIPRRHHEDGHVDPHNRNSAFSATSAGSLTFSGQSSSSVTSPPTPAIEYVSKPLVRLYGSSKFLSN